MSELPINQIIQGDCCEVMRGFPKESVDMVMFSPPYWGLRDYGVEGQIGLEKHPNEWIAKMVEVCRQVKRVLKKSGSLYLNVGDTYYGGRSMIKSNGFSLKETDRAWLGALIDCEGCIYVHKRSKGRKNATYGVGISVGNTKKELLEKAKNIVGVGSIACYPQPERRRKPIYRWVVMANEAKQVLRTIYPYLIAKRLQAKACLSLPSNGPIAKDIHKKVKLLNQGMVKVEDEWPEPEIETMNLDWGKALQPKQLLGMPWRLAIALQEDGWILRNAIIWFKKNHMPSSVKDRLTCAYEHIFHFVKARRYFYDLDAIRQPHKQSTKNRLKQDISSQYKQSKANEYAKNLPMKGGGQRKEIPQILAHMKENLNPLGKNPSDIITPRVEANLSHFEQKGSGGHYAYGGLDSSEGKHEHPKGKNPSDIIRPDVYEMDKMSKPREQRQKTGLSYGEKWDNPKGKNPSDFWSINTKPFPQAHFAVYPEAICEMPIKSSCPHAVCRECGKPKTRITNADRKITIQNPTFNKKDFGSYLKHSREKVGLTSNDVASHFPSKSGGLTGCVWNWENGVNLPTIEQYEKLKHIVRLDARYDFLLRANLRRKERENPPINVYTKARTEGDKMHRSGSFMHGEVRGSGQKVQDWLNKHPIETVGWSDCGCNKGFDSGIVLDPMCGAGTTLVVAQKLGRRWIGIDLKAEYVEMAKKRLMKECSQKLIKWA